MRQKVRWFSSTKSGRTMVLAYATVLMTSGMALTEGITTPPREVAVGPTSSISERAEQSDAGARKSRKHRSPTPKRRVPHFSVTSQAV